jgi:hypothetical protein
MHYNKKNKQQQQSEKPQQAAEQSPVIRPYWPFAEWKASAVLLAAILCFAISSQLGIFALVMGGIIAVGVILWYAARFLKWGTTKFILTKKALIYEYRTFLYLIKKSEYIPISKVTRVGISRNPYEWFVGAGDIVLETASEPYLIPDVANCNQVQKRLLYYLDLI